MGLKPCPFCGGKAELTTPREKFKNGYIVKCKDCGGMTDRWCSTTGAIIAWEKRISDEFANKTL